MMKGKVIFGLGFLLLGLTLPLISIATPAATASTPIVLRPTFPPLPTPTPRPTATPVPTLPPGAYIELHLTPPDPTLWTQVEWQDGLGEWHRVDGWQGPIDGVRQGIGWKRWWLAADLFGRGPFRWVALNHQDGTLIAASAPFTLPTGAGVIVVVPLSVPTR